jgi:hypothetical protein
LRFLTPLSDSSPSLFIADSLTLLAPPFETLTVKLSFAVDYEEAKAKFVKKTSTLKITVPRA